MAVTNERTIILRLDTRGDSRGLTETGRSLERLARGVDNLGGEMHDTTGDAAGLNTELQRTNDRIAELHAQVARTRDLSLFGDINKEERRARQLRRTLEAVVPDMSDAGADAANEFTTAFLGMIPTRLRGALILALVGLGAAMSPTIGAAVAGAVAGTVGIGGIAGGIAMASKDQRVRTAARSFANDISAEFFSGGGAFVQPTIQALETLRVGFHEMDLGGAFAKAAPFVDEFAEGVAGLGREFMPGFNRAMVAAGPALEMFGDELPQIGEALGTMIAQITESEGAMGGLQAILDGVAGTLRVTGDTVDYLSDRFRDSVDVGARIGTFASRAWGWVPVLGDHFQNTTRHFEDWQRSMDGVQLHTEGSVDMFRQLSGEIGKASVLVPQLAVDEKELAAAAKEVEKSQKDAADAVRDYNRAVDDAVSNAARLDASEDSVKLAMMDLSQSVKDNGKVWGDNTRAGLENREALRRVLATIDDVRRAQIGSGVDAQTANAAYNKQVEQLRTLGRRLGLTKGQIDDLIDDYKITITTHWVTRGSPPRLISSGAFAGDFRVEYGRILQRQHGGPVEPGGTYLVGEAGRPEILQMGPQARGHITPLPAGTSRGGEGGMLTLLVRSGGQSAFERFMADWIRRYVSIQGGGNVQKAFGKAT